VTRVVRFGVIGCGLMGREFASSAARWLHLEDTRARPEIVAVCDLNPALTDWFSANVPSVAQITPDYRALLANDDVEAVYCAVPHNLHHDIYPDILAAGKHLLGEKPFGIDAAANARIMSAIDAHPECLVRCSSELPYYPGAQRVVDFVRAGHLGEIIEVEAAFLHSSDLNPDKPINWKRMVDVNGAYGCMGRVLGTRGSAFFSTKNPRQWRYMHYDGGPQAWRVEDLGFQTLFPAITGGIFEFGFPDALQQMWAAFLDELAGGDANGFPCVTPAETADQHAILTAALAAGTTNTVQTVTYSP